MAYSQDERACESESCNTNQVESHNFSAVLRQDRRLRGNSPAAGHNHQHQQERRQLEKPALQGADEVCIQGHQPLYVNRPLPVRGGVTGACIRIGVAIDPLCPPVFPRNLPLLTGKPHGTRLNTNAM